MSIFGRITILGTICVLIAGCGTANLNSISRSTGYGKGARAIHLDAKQRVILGKNTEIGDIACAEPNPDALSAYAASFGAGAAAPNTFSASVAAAMSETSASIGLRTQSIQLMRDFLYRVCEAYHNRALNQVMVMQLQARSQDVMLGVLAVEQLTGAVTAKQVVLTGKAATSAQLLDLSRLLDDARNRETQIKNESNKSKVEAGHLDSEATKAEADLVTEQAKPAPNASTVKDLTAKAQEARSKADEAKTKSESDQLRLKDAQAATEIIQNSRNAAATSAKASATSGGTLSDTVSTSRFRTEDATVVANAVKEIVDKIVNKPRLLESCLAFLSRNDPNNDDQKETRTFCRGVLSHPIINELKNQSLL